MNKKGFTLIEMMIVVAIIAILVGIALPNMLGSRRAANERAALAELRTIGTAAEAYFVRENQYPDGTAVFFDTLQNDDFLPSNPYDGAGASITKSGYTIEVVSSNTETYNVTATPQNDRQGKRCFAVTSGGVLWQTDYTGGACDTNSWETI